MLLFVLESTQLTKICVKLRIKTLKKVLSYFKVHNKNTRVMALEFVLVFLLLTVNYINKIPFY